MFASDPLSLLFLGCALFSGLFLVVTVLLGSGHGHVGHLGGHAGGPHLGAHLGHAGNLGSASHAGPVGHLPAHTVGHVPAQAHASGVARSGAAAANGSSGVSLWGGLQDLLLGSLNLNGALIFLLAFGVLGYLLHTGQGLSTLTIVLVAALVGAITAIGVNAALTRLFITSQAGELSTESSRLEGRLASVSMAIRTDGLGEVIYTGEAGARQSMGARSADGSAIDAGTQVVIVASADGLAMVQPWDHFLAGARQRLTGAHDETTSAPEESVAPEAPPGL